MASFIGAREPEEIIFTSGTTDGLNLVAQGLAPSLCAGTAVVVSDLEHHSDFVPWQRACELRGAEFLIWRSNDGRHALEDLDCLLSERELVAYAMGRLGETEGVRVLGHPEKRSALVSFNLNGMSAFDVAFMLDKMGVAVRSGHHCAQPALRSLGVDTCVRASVAFYNEERDIDVLCDGLERLGTLCR